MKSLVADECVDGTANAACNEAAFRVSGCLGSVAAYEVGHHHC